MSRADVAWKIQRVRLDRIGPSAARFLDVTLDFRDGAGQPLDTILWLRNGGGKSTVLSLICALIRPHRRDFLATAATGKHLEDYVLGADTAHVVVEWSGPDGRTLVTGAVYEWAERTQPADPTRDHDRLNSRWYIFTEKGRAALDTLPFTTGDGTPTPLREFAAEVRGYDAIPGCDASVTDAMDRWRRLLDDHGLDPEIFTPILQMNATEGGIEGQFQFRNADQFVQYLLELIVDPEVAGQVAQILEGVRAGLAERPELMADHTFADEAAPRLRALAVAHVEQGVADERQAGAVAAAHRLHAGLLSAVTVAEEAAGTAAAAADGHRATAERHGVDDTTHQRRARVLRAAAAALRLRAAEDRATELTQLETELKLSLDTWQVTPMAAALRDAERRVEQLAGQLAAATLDAEPLRRRRDAAAGAYAVALDASVAELDEQVRVARADEEGELAAERAARAQGEAALAERARHTAALDAARDALAALDTDLAAAIAAGHLQPGETAAAGLDRQEVADRDAAAALDAVALDALALDEERSALRSRSAELVATRTAAERTHAEAAERRRRLTERVAELAADERLRALGDGEQIDPVAEAGDLGAALATAIARTERRRIELAVDGAEDERALAALAATQLLPGSLDLTRAHDTVDRAGIAAVTGWRYLADSVPAGQHAGVLRAAPALATGLLVHDPGDLDAARAALVAAGLRPTSAVLLATTADLAAAARAAPRADHYVVPPAPALTDRAASGVEQSARERTRGERGAVDAELVAALTRDAELQRRLRRLAQDCPPGTIEDLDATEEAAAGHLAALAAEAEAQAAAEADVDRRAAELETARAQAQRIRLAAATARGVLGALAPREHAAVDHLGRVTALPATIAAATSTIATAAAAEQRHRGRSAAARERATVLGRTAGAHRADREALGVVDPVPGAAPLPVSDARAAWESADQAYRREVAESALASSLDEARRALGQVRAQAAAVPAQVHLAARALLDTADGQDSDSRRAATARVEEEHAHARTVASEAQAQVRMARLAHEQLAVDAAEADDDLPGTVDDALAGADAADSAAAGARMLQDGALAAAAARAAENAAARDRATGLRHAAELLGAGEDPADTPPDTVGAPPYDGTVDDVRGVVESTRTDREAAIVEARRCRRAVERQQQELALWAASDRFSGVKPAVRDRFRGDLDDILPTAEQLADDLDLFAVQLRERLAELEEHKGVVVTAMVGMVRQALKALTRAQSLSELPASLGEWAGQRFLEVGPRSTVETADAVLRDRCARLVDSLTARGTPVPRGQELLWLATSAVVGEGNWKARVLKPSTTFAIERVSVERMRKWSGGEKVTISLLLFCMVAKLRAGSRGRDQPGLGALPLDNPLGKANYVVFLNLQRKVATANGIQLIFLTGVGDLRAVGRFPNVVRLRNTRSRSREYVSVLDRTVADTDPAGIVDATRVWRENTELTLL